MSVAYDWRSTDGRRKPGVRRSCTEGRKHLGKRMIAEGAAEFPPSVNAEYERPRTVGDCERMGLGRTQRCPFVSCKHHLYLDVDPRTGSIKYNFPDREVWEMPETCALVVADRGESTLEVVGALTNVVRERVRQIVDQSTAKLRRHLPVYEALATGAGE